MSGGGLRWRKFSPIDRESPIYELVDGDVVILDVTRGDDEVEVTFHQGASGRVFALERIEELLAQVRDLLAGDDAA